MAQFHTHNCHDNLIHTHLYSPCHPATSNTALFVLIGLICAHCCAQRSCHLGRSCNWEMDLGSSIPTLPFGPIRTPFLNHSRFCLPGAPAIIPAIVSGVVNRQKCGKPAWLPPSALPPADRHAPTCSFASCSLPPLYRLHPTPSSASTIQDTTRASCGHPTNFDLPQYPSETGVFRYVLAFWVGFSLHFFPPFILIVFINTFFQHSPKFPPHRESKMPQDHTIWLPPDPQHSPVSHLQATYLISCRAYQHFAGDACHRSTQIPYQITNQMACDDSSGRFLCQQIPINLWAVNAVCCLIVPCPFYKLISCGLFSYLPILSPAREGST